MNIYQILILISSIDILNAQNCDYVTNEWPGYTCYLSINNPAGTNNFKSISGDHAANKMDSSVLQIKNHESTVTKNFPSIVCHQFQNTEKILFKNAGIETIEDDSFIKCIGLKELQLGMNRISHISENALSNNALLTGLTLAGNQLTSLPENLLSNQVNLQALLIGNNPLDFIPERFFRALRYIQALYINHTNLKRISPAWFENFQNLQAVYINNNQFTDIPDGTFKNLMQMQYMNLEGNKIKEIRAAAFAPQSNWQFLDLSNNRIEAVERKFAEQVNVQVIQMNGNVCFSGSVVNVFKFRNLDTCFRNFRA